MRARILSRSKRGRLLLAFPALFALFACREDAPSVDAHATRRETPSAVAPAAENPPSQPAAAPAVTPMEKPTGPFLFQPYFYYGDEEPSANGTGFLVRAPGGRVAAIASAHFVNFEGEPLNVVKWLSISDWTPMLTFEKSWGLPGNGGVADGMTIDLRMDYLILPVEQRVPNNWVLKLDKRGAPEKKEIVWFPNKTDDAEIGYVWVNGFVLEAEPTHIFVVLDQAVAFQSQSGSPVISSVTGRVIGTISRVSSYEGRPVLWLTPAASIREALQAATEFPALKDVIGAS
ncbi:MAG TPA: hypothetical protein P5081_24775 [Phycisphaerae bacterium]|nr:hypothetical protein [Phycisphaerae bacterium]HRW56102.1 hypothetical protein [Phycisphaerae bacterium]